MHLDFDYPDAETDFNRWLPLVKWLLAIPHYVALRRRCGRWTLRVEAYATLLVTDRYPPFSLR